MNSSQNLLDTTDLAPSKPLGHALDSAAASPPGLSLRGAVILSGIFFCALVWGALGISLLA